MAPKTTLNARNLEALGAQRLAELLIELSTGNAAAKRRLRLALAATTGPGAVAWEIRKRLTALARARTVVDWPKRRALVEDLEAQRRAIVEQVAPDDPADALSLMWQFLALDAPTLGRCDDGSGEAIGVFTAAVADLGEIASAAQPNPTRLADDVYEALTRNDYGDPAPL